MDDIAAMSAVAVPIEINEMLEQLHRFAHNVKRSGGIAETFLCGIPDSEEDGGLSIGVKNQCIFFGSRLKSKIFQLVALYNAYFQHMDDVVEEARHQQHIQHMQQQPPSPIRARQ
ncbi:hypothetical protein BC831DRAFT_512846 [Entophlyctis helioformis]|nr:hypothetical protein BC831DRAFT_512846 [Entophlyctis helioformis]